MTKNQLGSKVAVVSIEVLSSTLEMVSTPFIKHKTDYEQYCAVQTVFAIGKPPEDQMCLFRHLKNVVVLPSVG
jgi:hypothetical protein